MQLVCVAGPPAPPVFDAGRQGDPTVALERLVDTVFDQHGATWDDPSPLPPAPNLEPEALADATAVLEGEGHIVWSDPRSAFAWRWLRELADVTVVSVLPEPRGVVAELVGAANVSGERAALLWLEYLLAVAEAPSLHLITAGEVAAEAPAETPSAARLREAIAQQTRRGTATDDEVATELSRESVALLAAVRAVAGAKDLLAFRALAAELRAHQAARRRLNETNQRLEVAIRVAQEERDRSRQLGAAADELRDRLAAVEERWIVTAREATARERELARQAQHSQHQLRELEQAYREVRQDYTTLTGRRSVQAALTAAAAAKPVLERARELLDRDRRQAALAPASQPLPTGRVATVVLNHRNVADTLECAASLARSEVRDQRLVVVDNGSGSAEVERLRVALSPRTVLDAGDNLGYAAGNNLGIRHVLARGAEFVWILNPDTIVEPDTLTHLLRTMHQVPDAGIVGGRLLNADSSPVTIASDGGMIDFDQHGASDHLHAGTPDRGVAPSEPYDVDFVSGSSMLVRRAVFDVLGLLPEHWFLYFEETSFNLAVSAAGWRIVVAPRARIWHAKRSSGRLPAPTYVYYFVRNRLQFAREHAPDWDGELPPDLAEWIRAWRTKVERADPTWAETYERLVSWALDDGHAGVTGRRPDIEDVAAGGSDGG